MLSRGALLAAAAAVVGLAACKGATQKPPATTAKPAQVAPAASAGQPQQAVQPAAGQAGQAVPVAPQLQAFVYDPTGLRDPFEPFIKIEEKKPEKVAPRIVAQTPLQRYSTEELKLVGIVWGEEGRARGLIEDPQGKGYAVGVGTLVGDRGGRVARVLPDRIVIEERFKDVLGEEKKNVANMMLHKSEGEVPK